MADYFELGFSTVSLAIKNMDITGSSPQRIKAGVELLLEGHALVYEGIAFWKDKNRALQVNSYSDWEPENSTAEMAKEKIKRAKSVLIDLSAKSPEFQKIANSLPHEHYFCYDYGNGAFTLAKEVNDIFEWQYVASKNG